MKVRPLNDRVLVLRLEQPERYSGSRLVRPEVSKTAPQEGVVLAVGEGRSYDGPGLINAVTNLVYAYADGNTPVTVTLEISRQTPRLKPGDIVVFGKFSGSEVELTALGGEALFLLREDEVLGVIEEPNEELKERVEAALAAHEARDKAN